MRMLQYRPHNMTFRFIGYYILLVIAPIFIPLRVLKAQRPDIYLPESQFQESPTAQSAAFLSKAYQDLAHWFEKAPQFNVDSTAYYLEKAIKVAESIQPIAQEALANAYFKAARFYREQPKRDDLIEKAWEHSEMIPDKHNYKQLQYDILMFWSKYSVRDGQRTKGIGLYQRAYTLFQNEKSSLFQAQLMKDAYDFYYVFDGDEGSTELRFEKIKKAHQLYLSINDKNLDERFLSIYGAYIIYYLDKGQLDTSLFYLNKFKELLPSNNNPSSLAWHEMMYGKIEMQANNFDTAESHIQTALNILETYHLTNGDNYQYCLFLLGSICTEQGRYDTAIEYFKKSMAIAVALNNKSSIMVTASALSDAYEKKGDLKQSLAYFKLYYDETIKQKKEQYDKGIQDLQIRLDTEGKEKELTKQKAKLSIYIGIIIVSLLLMGLILFFYTRQRRDKAALQNQNTIINKQSEDLRLLDKAKTRFFANVSHELRTPLTLMLGPLSTMIKSGSLDNKNFTLASLVKQNAQGLLILVNEILDLNKLEAGKLALNVEKTVVYNLIRRIIAGFESTAEINDIDFTFDYKTDKYLQLWLDNNKFEKILNNLLSNAFKFTKPKGKVNVTVSEGQNGLKIVVSDTGRGIHPDDLPHIFNRFYQSNQPNALTEGGTGIGLSLTKELVKLMGGQLSVESTLDSGSTFTIELPKKEVMGAIPTPEAEEMMQDVAVITEGVDLSSITTSESSKGVKSTILIVEDNHSLRDYLSLILSPQYTILKAENGSIALDILSKNQRVDLILSDVMMPIMDGFQLLSHLKSSDVYCSIPVIMLTARAELQDKLKALRIGVDDYLVKPFEEEELFARIENLMRHAQLRRNLSHDEAVEDDNFDSDTEGVALTVPTISAIDMAWLEHLEKSVKQNLKDINYSVERMASDMSISRIHLYRKLKPLTGLSPQQYLQEVRLQQALHLLETQQEHSVKAVCYAVGLLQVNHFSQLFHQRFGKLPSSYLN